MLGSNVMKMTKVSREKGYFAYISFWEVLDLYFPMIYNFARIDLKEVSSLSLKDVTRTWFPKEY